VIDFRGIITRARLIEEQQLVRDEARRGGPIAQLRPGEKIDSEWREF